MAHRDAMPAAVISASAAGTVNSTTNTRALSVAQPFTPINPNVVKIPSLSPTWQFIGPRNAPGGDLADPNDIGGGRVNPPISGRVSAVTFDAVHPGTVYLVAPTGGVWKSTDNGFNWVCLSDGPSFPTLSSSSVAVHPITGNTLLVGTGDYDGFQAFGYGVGIMRSTDAGQTWTVNGNALMRGLAVSGVCF